MILCNITPEDSSRQFSLLGKLNALGFYDVKVTMQTLSIDLIEKAKLLGAEAIVCSNVDSLANLVPSNETANLEDWRGSVFFYCIPVIIINPLIHAITLDHGDFLLSSDLKKVQTVLANKFQNWRYDYCICNTQQDLLEAAEVLKTAECLVVDIETTRDNRISDISFTPITDYKVGRTYQMQLLPENYATTEEWKTAWIAMTSLLKAPMPKAFHNGVFDVFQLTRFQVEVNNYLFDTEYMWWSWYAELKKSLAFVSSVVLPDYLYWKKSAESDPRGYNAKDTINTARVLIHLLKDMPLWAKRNYAKTIPNVYPAIYMQFEGFEVDVALKETLKVEANEDTNLALKDLKTLAGSTAFNPASPYHVSFYLYKIFGATKPKRSKSATGSDAISLAKVALQHPILARFISQLIAYRKASKAYTTYYCADLYGDRLLYGVQLDGTDTGRYSSNKSPLWVPNPGGLKKNERNYGAQIQNQPKYMKKALIADTGYLLGNVDKSQSEARCTAALSGDQDLYQDLYRKPTEDEIATYSGDADAAGDFYCRCTYRYFGLRITKDDPERQITKKINHGTNYMMQEDTFIDSVGILKVRDAMAVLKRPNSESLKAFAGFCLGLYHSAYPAVAPWWKDIKVQIAKHGYYETPDGWRRLFFGDIVKKHAIWRSAVAHGPQHFSVAGINKAIYRLYYNVQIPSEGEYRLKCQVHDSITYQAKEEKIDYYTAKTLEVMDIPQYVRPGLELRIPLDAEIGKAWKGMTKWTRPTNPI